MHVFKRGDPALRPNVVLLERVKVEKRGPIMPRESATGFRAKTVLI